MGVEVEEEEVEVEEEVKDEVVFDKAKSMRNG